MSIAIFAVVFLLLLGPSLIPMGTRAASDRRQDVSTHAKDREPSCCATDRLNLTLRSDPDDHLSELGGEKRE